MKSKLIAAIALFMTITSSQTFALGRDGNWWVQQDGSAKLSYIAGMIDGIAQGSVFPSIRCMETGGSQDEISVCVKKVSGEHSESLNKYVVNKSPNQMLSGIESYYSDYRNLEIPAGTIFVFVLQSLAGDDVPEQWVESMRELYRGKSN